MPHTLAVEFLGPVLRKFVIQVVVFLRRYCCFCLPVGFLRVWLTGASKLQSGFDEPFLSQSLNVTLPYTKIITQATLACTYRLLSKLRPVRLKV